MPSARARAAALSFLLLPSLAGAADTVSGNFSTSFSFDSGGSDRGRAIAVEASSFVYVAGKKPQGGGGIDWVILKLDPSGVFVSSTGFDSGASTFEEPMDAIVAGPNLIVVGSEANSRRINVYSTGALQAQGSYADGQNGRFTAVISSGPNSIITASVVGGQMIVNELAVPGLVMVATRVVPGTYGAEQHGRTLAHDPSSGRIYAVAIDSTTGGMRVEELGAGLTLLGATNYFRPEPFVGGAALAWAPVGLYAVGLASGGANAVTYIFRMSGLTFLNASTMTASGFISNIDERVVVVDPATQDVYVAGSGPFPGIVKFSSDLVGSVTKTLFPTSSLAVQNINNLYAVEVNQTGPQDIQVHKKDFNSLPSGGGGGGSGVTELASDGTYIYLGHTDSASPGIAEIYKVSPPNTLIASGTISGLAQNQDIKLIYRGASLYVIGAASGPTTLGVDAAVWKIDPNTIVMVSSRTLDSTGGVGEDVVMAGTTTSAGNLMLAGAVANSATTYAAALWSYNTGSDSLTLLSSLNAPGANTDLFSGIASTGTDVFWAIGYSSVIGAPGPNKMGLALWRYQAGSLQMATRLDGFAGNLDIRADITASASALFVGAERKNSAGNLDLAFLKYDLGGSTVAEKYWHTESPFKHEVVGGITLDSAGDPLIAGGTEDLATSSGASAYWSYAAVAATLNSGFPKSKGDGRLYRPVRHGADVYSAVHQSSTPILLTGGSAVSGAENLQGGGGGPTPPAVLSYSGSLPSGANVNSTDNRNEALFGVIVDSATGNVFTVAHSTTNPVWGATPDDTFVLKYSPSGVVLASAPLQGTHSGDALAFDGTNVYVAEKAEPTTRRLVKFDANLVRIASVPVSAGDVGNITKAVFKNGFLYTINDGGSSSPGAKLIKYDSALNEVARSTLAPFGGSDHHNGDDITANVPGDIYVAVTSPSLAVIKGAIYRFDANLVQLSSADITGTLGSGPRLAYGGGKLFVGSGDNAPPAHAILHQYDSSSLTSLGTSSFVYVAGASVDPALAATGDSLVVGLTSSTADGGSFFALRLNHSFVQISSGLFDAGFSNADSLLSVALGPTNEVYMTGVGRNGLHYDGVVMVRTLPTPPSGGLSFSGSFASGATAAGPDADTGYAVARDTITGSVYVVGTTSQGVSGLDALVVKYNASGTMLASATFNGSGGFADSALAAAVAPNGQLYLTGVTHVNSGGSQDILVLRYDGNLVLLSSATHNGGPTDAGLAIVPQTDGTLFVAGNEDPASQNDAILIHYSASLGVIGSPAFLDDSTVIDGDRALAVTRDASDNILMAGRAHRSVDRFDLFVARFNPSGSFLSSGAVAGTWSMQPSPAAGIVAHPDGSVYVSASTNAAGGDALVAKFNSSLVFQATAAFGGAGLQVARTLLLDATGDLLLAGDSLNSYWLARVSPGLALLSSATFSAGTFGQGNGAALDAAGKAIVTGKFSNGSNDDMVTALMNAPLPPPPPPPAGSTVTVSFAGNFLTGAKVFNDAGGADIGHRVAFMPVGPSTFVYVTVHSTTSATPGNTPDQLFVVKYDLNGSTLASTLLQGNHSGDVLVAHGGFVYVSEKDQSPGTMRRMIKLDANLGLRLATATLDADAVGNITDAFARDGFIYTINDGGNASNGAKLIKYDANLNEVARATYSFGASHANGNGVTVTPNGEVFVTVNETSGGLTKKIVKYNSGLGPVAERDVTSLWPGSIEDLDVAFANGVLMAAAYNSTLDRLFVRKFDPSLNYSGASATFTVYSPMGVAFGAGPEGLFYVALSSPGADVSNFALKVLDPDLIERTSTVFDGSFAGQDHAVGLAVLDSSNVFVTGAEHNGVNFEAMTFVKNLSAAGGGFGGPGGQPGGFWGIANKDSRIWAVQRGLEVARMYEFPAPPVSRNSAFAQELGFASGLREPTALAVDGGGNLWVSVSTAPGAPQNRRLVRFASQGGPGQVAGSTSAVLSSLLADVHAIAFRQETGDIWVAQGGANPSIVSILRDGASTLGAPTYSDANASTFTTNAQLGYAEALAFDTGGNLWVTARTLGEIRMYPKAAGSISASTGQVITAVAAPGAVAFDTAGNMYIGEASTTTPFSGKLWKFQNQGSVSVPSISNSPVQVQTGVDPTALTFVSGQLWGTSDLNDQIVQHPTEPPPPPNQFGTVQGTLSYFGPRTGSNYRIGFTTRTFGFKDTDAAALTISTFAPGSFSVPTLKAPNTYYAIAFLDLDGSQQPNGVEPFGQHSAATTAFAPRQGFFVGVDQTVTGRDIRLWDWVAVTGTVTNQSAQTGSIKLQTWMGAPNPGDPSTRFDFHPSLGVGATQYVVYTATMTNLHIRAFVDSNFNDEHEAGEDFVDAGPIDLSAKPADSTTTVNIAIGSSPAGQLFFNAASIIGANIPTNGEAAFLKLQAWSGAGNVQLSGLRVTLKGDAPAPNAFAKVFKDANGNGTFQPGVDFVVGDKPFSGSVPPTASITFFSTESVTASTATYFIGLSFFGLPAGKTAGVALDASSAFTFAAGSLAAGQGPFPVESALAVSQFSLSAKPFDQGYPVPQGGANPNGGFDTGLYINPGQRVEVNASGVWNTGALGTSGPGGLGSTGGLGAGLPIGALVGRIGGSAWFLVGTSTNFISGFSGPLALAMNDTDYNDNSASLAVDFRIVPSTTTRTWLGTSGFGLGADIPQNWQGGQLPQPGESVRFDGSVSNADCDWNLFQLSLGAWTMASSYTGTVRLRGTSFPDDFNAVYADSHVVVSGGRLELGRNKNLRVQGGLLVTGGVLDLGQDGVYVDVGPAGVRVDQGGLLRYAPAAGGYAAFNPAGFERYPFDVAAGTIEVSGVGLLRIARAGAVDLTASADIRGFHNVQFDDWDSFGAGTALRVARSTAAVLTFKGLEFMGQFLKNVDAGSYNAGGSLTMLDSKGPKRGTPFEIDPNGVLHWLPDGGGVASIAGDVVNGGVTISFSSAMVRASTQPFFDQYAPLGGLQFDTNRAGYGAYTLNNLDAPNTYYLYAWGDSVQNFFPEGQEPRGGFGKPGLFRSDPVFVAPNDSLTGKNITLKDWGEISGTVNNNSQQFGPILVGAAHVNSTTTLEVVSFGMGPGAFPLLSVPATSLVVVGWVDVNNNRQRDGFEASGSTQVIQLPQSQVYPGSLVLNLSGGSAAAGGTPSVTPSVAHKGILGDNGPQPLLKLQVAGAGSQSVMTGLKLDYQGGPSNFELAVYVDGNGNGQFEGYGGGAAGPAGPSDFFVGSTQAFSGTNTSVVNFFNPQFINAGSTTTLFVVFQPFGLQAGHPKQPPLAVSIGASNYFLLSAGQMAADPVYPIQTSAPIGWTAFGSTQGDPFGGGGYYTGLTVAPGQQVVVTATGAWQFNGQSTGPQGLPGTEGAPNLLRGARTGALLVSANGGWVAVGTGTTITAGPNGGLGVHLSANDVPGDYFNNFGEMLVNLAVTGSTTSHVQGTIAYTGGLTGNMFVNLTQDCQFAPPGCNPILSTQTLTLAGGTTLYAYGLHVPFGGFFSVRASVQADPSHRSGLVPSFQAPIGSTATVDFPVFSGLGTITSTISYGGVMNFGEFFVGVATSPDLERDVQFFGSYFSTSAGAFAITSLPIPNTYYMVGFRDGNFNDHPDGPEPIGAIASVPSSQFVLSKSTSLLTPIFVSSTAHVSQITMVDRGGVQGRLFFQQAVPSGQAIILAGHDKPGSPGFTVEARDFRFVQNVPANGSVDYFLGLLRPATDYTLFAFHDQNFNGQHDAGEPFGATFDFLSVPSGGFANKDVVIGAPQAPGAVQGFGLVNFGTNYVEFLWNSVPNATGYLLLDASSATVQALGASATVYNQSLAPAALSTITGIRAVNNEGQGPIARLPANLIAASAAVPVPAPTFSNVGVSSATVSWTNGGNSGQAKYQLERATQQAGPFQPVHYDTTLTKNENGLAPATTYYYQVKAQSPNGGFAAPSATASVVTLPSVDPSIAGLLSYAGRQTGSIWVQAFTSSNPFAGLTASAKLPNATGQPYYLAVPSGGYFLRAFVDVSGNGTREAGESQGTLGPVSVAGAPVTGQDFSIAVDTTPTAPPSGLAASVAFGRVDLRWNAPAASDLAGFRVQRTLSGSTSFTTLSTGTVFGATGTVAGVTFSDLAPLAGGDNVYRVIAVDYAQNESIPSGALAVKPALGGTISGAISTFTATTQGAFRVRLSTSPRRTDPFLAESTLGSFSFTGLADGVYFLRGFRDVNADNQQDAASEPSGTHGGLAAPFPINIVGGNTVTGRTVTICDRTTLPLGSDQAGALAASDCRALDKGPNNYTDLYTFRAGGGAAGSVGVGSEVDISMIVPGNTFSPELIVLGPGGQVVARDNNPFNPHVHFPATEPGIYIVEPTSFDPAKTGNYSLLMNVFGGFSGALNGVTSYSGSKTGPIRLQLFESQDANAFPFFMQDQANPGPFSIGGLRDGTFYLRVFRDVNGNFAKDPGEPSGAFGFSESSPTAISVVGGVPNQSNVSVTLSDPATGRVEGAISRQGSLSGVIRVEVGPRACSDCSDLDVVAFTTLPAAGNYALDFIAPATNYIVQAFVDQNSNNRGDALEAKGSSSPVTVQANSTSTVNILVRDPGTGNSGTSVIFGTVSYTGSQTGTLFIGFASDQNFNYIPYFLTQSATGSFSRSGIAGGTTYYVGAFLDVNGNGTIDEDGALVEPVGDANGQLFVPNSSSVGVAFAISDPSSGSISGVVTYSGAVSGPLVVQASRESSGGGGGHGGFRSVSITRAAGVSTYAYTAGFLDSGDFRLYAFVDSNLNQRSDFGEPFFRRDSLVSLATGAAATGVNLVVFDAGAGGGSGEIGRIEGTLSYAGGQPGPVVVQAYTTSTFVGIPFRATNAGGGPSSFSFFLDNLPNGTYFLRAFKDGNFNQALEPQFEANGLVAGGSGIAVSKDSPFSAGHTGTLVDAGQGGPAGSNSLSGEVHYRGGFSSGTFFLGLFQDADFDGDTDDLLRLATFPFSAAPFSFNLSNLPGGQFFLRGFLDRNGNFSPDESEPFGVTDAQGISVFGPTGGLIISVCDRTALPAGSIYADTIPASGCFSRESETLGAASKLLTFRGARGQIVDLELDAAEDSVLYLYDEHGQLVAQADEGGSEPGDARIAGVTLPDSGVYTLAATFFSPGVTGPFRVIQRNSGGTPGALSGEVVYSGSQGGRIIMGLFNSPDFDAAGSFVDGRELPGPGPFSFPSLASETSYFLGAFVDVNFNHHPDQGEDFAVFSTAPPVATPIYLQAGQDVSGLVLTIAASTAAYAGNEGRVTGVASYAGTLSGVMRVEFWPNSSFTGAPLAVRAVPTGVGPYDLSVPGGQPYVVRGFLDVNGDYAPNPNEPVGVYSPSGQGAEPVFVPSNGAVGGVDFTLRDPGIKLGQDAASGEGSVNFSPASAAAGSAGVFVSSFVVGPSGLGAGGLVAFGVPPGWTPPQGDSAMTPGYTTVSAAGTTISTQAAPGGVPGIVARVVGTPLAAGATVLFRYNAAVPCFLGPTQLFFGSASSQTVAPSPLFLGQPTVNVALGNGTAVRSAEPFIGLIQGATSQRLLLEAVDVCGNRVPVAAQANVILRAVGSLPSQTGLKISSSVTGVFDSTAIVTFQAGVSTAAYRLLSYAAGDLDLEIAANLLAPGSTGYARAFALGADPLAHVRVSTTPGTALATTSATIRPDGNPLSPNLAFINFKLGDPTLSWSVSVASTPYKADVTPFPVAFFSSLGQPATGQIAWDGRDFRGQRVAQGVYYVRVEAGGIRNDSLKVFVQAAQLGLKVFDAGVTPNLPLSGVFTEVFGQFGGGTLETDSVGEAVLSGLAAGSYRLNFTKDGYLVGRASVTVSSASAILGMQALDNKVSLASTTAGQLQVLMRRAPSLIVVPSIPVASTQPYIQWGELQISNASGTFTRNGPMRLAAGATTFDDGGQWDPSVQQFVTKTILRFQVASDTYAVRARFSGFEDVESTGVFVADSGETRLTLPQFSRRGAFTGRVQLPAGAGSDMFVSVSAVPITTTTLLEPGFGGVEFRATNTSATYRVDGLKAGSYRLTANAQGFKAVFIGSSTIVNGADTTANFPDFASSTSTVLVATVGVNWGSNAMPELEPGVHARLFVSAWAPNSPNVAYANVSISTIGVSSASVVLNLTGLEAGLEYQVFADLEARSDADFDAAGGFPKTAVVSTVTGRGALAFDFTAASGVVQGTIYISSSDFSTVELFGETIAAARPDQVGHTFQERAQDLPGIVCGNGTSTTTLGDCAFPVNVASFTVRGLNTETLDITFKYGRTGRTSKQRVSIVNGSTTTVLVDLRDPTFSITGAVSNQIGDAAFDTNPELVANAALVPVRDAAGNNVAIDTATVDLGGASSVMSLARVLAIKQLFGVAASTNFNPATDRVGYLTAAGTFTIRNVVPGTYLVRTADIRACSTCAVIVPRRAQTVTVAAASVQAATFTLSDGFSVSGVAAIEAGVQDARTLRLTLRNRRLEVIRSTGVALGNAAAGVAAGAVSYRLDGVPAGEFYTLSVEDVADEPKYVGKPRSFPDPTQSPNGLQANLVSQDVTLRRAGYVTGRLQDAASGELFTERNARVLPPNLRITATANPWVEGGFAQAASSVSARPIRVDGTFLVGPLFPETAYDLKVFQDKWDLAFLAQGSQNYAPVELSGLILQPLERKDVGTLSLNQGTSIKGTLVDAASTATALGNIKVTAKPSSGDGLFVETFSNSLGEFTLWVSTFVSPQYDVTVAPRDGNLASDGRRFQTVDLRSLLVSTAPLNLQLRQLLGAVTGQVLTADGGELSYPFGDDAGFPAAAVFLQPAGVNPRDNPLGDIAVQTGSDGRFEVPGLATGTYTLRAVSLGYGVANATVTVDAASFCISTDTVGGCDDVTLRLGGGIAGRILLPDGSAPSADEVGGVAAANDDFSKFVLGTVSVDPNARTISGYSITGFETGVTYDLVILPPEKDDLDVVHPAEGQGVSFSAAESTTTKTINLTYSRATPDCSAETNEEQLGNGQFQIKITCSEPLRRLTSADDDVDLVISTAAVGADGIVYSAPNGTGGLLGGSNKKIENDRRKITVIYRTGDALERCFSLKLNAYVTTVDPATGDNFLVSKTFDFSAGAPSNPSVTDPRGCSQSATRVVTSETDQPVNNSQGGEVDLQSYGDQSGNEEQEQFELNFQAGSFEDCDAGDSNANCQGQQGNKDKVKVKVRASLDSGQAANLAMATLGYVPARIAAMQAAGFSPSAASTDTSNPFKSAPFSTFYDVFLPLGIRSQLNKPVDITLPYDLSLASATPASNLNVWSLSNGVVKLEDANKRIDTVNNTITVSVDHFSTFVILGSTPVFSSQTAFRGGEIEAYNFPNPFDCSVKTRSINNLLTGNGGIITYEGTLIRYALPAGGPDELRVRIYNVAGELVKDFSQGSLNGGFIYYSPWDCKNQSGRAVASGVYIGEIKWGDRSKFFKMALIKGSGL